MLWQPRPSTKHSPWLRFTVFEPPGLMQQPGTAKVVLSTTAFPPGKGTVRAARVARDDNCCACSRKALCSSFLSWAPPWLLLTEGSCRCCYKSASMCSIGLCAQKFKMKYAPSPLPLLLDRMPTTALACHIIMVAKSTSDEVHVICLCAMQVTFTDLAQSMLDSGLQGTYTRELVFINGTVDLGFGLADAKKLFVLIKNNVVDKLILPWADWLGFTKLLSFVSGKPKQT